MSAMECGDVWAPKELSAFTATITGIIFIVGTIGNALIVFIVIKDPLKKLHTPFNYFIVNLAVSDLIVDSIVNPLAVYTHVLEYLGKLDNTTVKVLHISFFISVTASILSLIALSVDRYVAITIPLKYRKYLNWFKCGCISVGIWLFSLSIPFLYFKFGFNNYFMVYANSGILVGLCVLIFTYIKVYKFLRKHTQQMKIHLKADSRTAEEFMLKRLIMEKKVTRVFLTVLVLFVVNYLPPTIMVYILEYCPNCDCIIRHWLRDLSANFVIINSCINPFVYTIRLKPFRQSIQFYFTASCYDKQRKRFRDSTTSID